MTDPARPSPLGCAHYSQLGERLAGERAETSCYGGVIMMISGARWWTAALCVTSLATLGSCSRSSRKTAASTDASVSKLPTSPSPSPTRPPMDFLVEVRLQEFGVAMGPLTRRALSSAGAFSVIRESPYSLATAQASPDDLTRLREHLGSPAFAAATSTSAPSEGLRVDLVVETPEGTRALDFSGEVPAAARPILDLLAKLDKAAVVQALPDLDAATLTLTQQLHGVVPGPLETLRVHGASAELESPAGKRSGELFEFQHTEVVIALLDPALASATSAPPQDQGWHRTLTLEVGGVRHELQFGEAVPMPARRLMKVLNLLLEWTRGSP